MRTAMLKPLMVAITSTLAMQAIAGPLADGYSISRLNDAQFLSAGPEKESNDLQAAAARAAYLPTVQMQQSQYQNTTSTSRTLSITQPLIAADRAATVLEGTPRYKLAEVIYAQRESELATRYFKVVSDWLKASEGLTLVKAKKESFTQQYVSAKRALEEGVGTVSDRQDALLRLEQAKSEEINLKAQQSAASSALALMTGQRPNLNLRAFASSSGDIVLEPEEDVLALAMENNRSIAQARLEGELADLAVWKARGALAPQLSFVVAQTAVNGTNSNYTGIQLSMPLQAGTIAGAIGARAAADKQRMVMLDAENKVRLDISRLYALVNAGVSELAVRRSAVDTATLGVESSEKSFKGGVRSKTDVLNAIQALYQAKQDLITSRLTLAENYLSLALQQGKAPQDALQRIDALLFGAGGAPVVAAPSAKPVPAVDTTPTLHLEKALKKR